MDAGVFVQLLIDIIGWVGMVSLLLAYGLLTARVWAAASWQYQILNLVGAGCLTVNTAYYQAWPSAALNVVWFVIGAIGLLKGRGASRAAESMKATASPS